jgi:sugar phosphate isomerase/epimerase
MSHPLSLAFLTLFDCPPLEAIQAAAASGFDRIGLRLLPAAPTESPYPILTDERVFQEVLAALADTALAVADVEIVRLKEGVSIPSFSPFLERAARMGAKHVLVAGDDGDPSRLTDSFGTYCRLAAQFGLTGDLEFMPWTKVPDLATASAIVEGAGEANGGLLVDALHLDRSTTTLDEVAALPRARVNYVQFCDGPAVYDPSDEGMIHIARAARLFPGEGGIDLVGLARVIPDDVTISVEVPNHALAKTSSPHERAAKAIASTRAILKAALEPLS